MVQVAVCDDDADYLHKMTDLLHVYFQTHSTLHGQISVFQRGEELLEQAGAQSGFDLYLLDVLMPGLNGIQTGHRLRELGDGGEIIYLSTSDDYAVDSYDVSAFFYLLKPVDREKLFLVLDRAVAQLERRRSSRMNSVVIVSTPQGPRRVRMEDIRYVERVGRIMRYHCAGEVVDSQSIRTSFKDMTAPLLSDGRFYRCGASFVLNLQHVTGVRGQSALLDDGGVLPLPRMAVAAFKNAWGKFWLEENTTW